MREPPREARQQLRLRTPELVLVCEGREARDIARDAGHLRETHVEVGTHGNAHNLLEGNREGVESDHGRVFGEGRDTHHIRGHEDDVEEVSKDTPHAKAQEFAPRYPRRNTGTRSPLGDVREGDTAAECRADDKADDRAPKSVEPRTGYHHGYEYEPGR